MSERAAKPKKKPAPRGADKYRSAESQKIQIAKRWAIDNLGGFDDDTYRDILQEAGSKKHSSTDLDWRGRMAVLKRFKELGWVAIPAKKAHTNPNPPQSPLIRGETLNSSPDKGRLGGVCRRQADDDQSKMCRGLWIDLHTLGEVRDPSEKALNGFVKRMTKISDLSWCNDNQKHVVIEALKDMRARRTLKLMTERSLKDHHFAIPEALCIELQVALRGLRISEQPKESAVLRLGAAGYQLLCEYKKWEGEVYARI